MSSNKKKAIITIGVSASGKSTWANNQKGFVVISRDDLRYEFLVKKLGIKVPLSDLFKLWKWHDEKDITQIQYDLIKQNSNKNQNVIIADTNITDKTRKQLTTLLNSVGYQVEYKYFDIDLEVAIERDKNREVSVGKDVITQQWNKLYGKR